ncbi:hypothetical protein NE237_019854 [Protea cynaroides]|uniref:Uncharacterized protein n=1 Tax=Protea cynaroides TaxID=273540 RepID=A0A9Q0K138_9MAGN|nr:hypothetical protein NE237_019854 [Protea cynaroides]
MDNNREKKSLKAKLQKVESEIPEWIWHAIEELKVFAELDQTVEKTARASQRLKGKAVSASSSEQSRKSSSPCINVSTTPIVRGLQLNNPVRTSLPPSSPILFSGHSALHKGPSRLVNEGISSELLSFHSWLCLWAELSRELVEDAMKEEKEKTEDQISALREEN